MYSRARSNADRLDFLRLCSVIIPDLFLDPTAVCQSKRFLRRASDVDLNLFAGIEDFTERMKYTEHWS